MEKIDIAINIAKKAFSGKVDKAGEPYLSHLSRVKDRCAYYYPFNAGPSEINDLKIIAILHDLLEDCPEWGIEHIDSIFQTASIKTALMLLTKKSGQNYDDYISGIKGHSYSRAVKLADLEDDMDITRLKALNDEDIERLKKYHKAYIQLTK